MGLPLQALVKKSVHGVETDWLSIKDKVPDTAFSKEGHTDSVLGYEKTPCYQILGKRCNCKQWFLLPTPKVIFVKYSLAHNMRLGKNSHSAVKKKSDAPEESDLWTAWLLFLLDDDHTCHSEDSGCDTSQWSIIERNRAGVLGW